MELGMNEAMFLTDEQIKEIHDAINTFCYISRGEKKVALGSTVFGDRPTGIVITIDEKSRKFIMHPEAESWDTYINRLKAFLFDELMKWRIGL